MPSKAVNLILLFSNALNKISAAAKGYFEVFVGEEVNTSQLPVSLSSKYIPASDYLKITLTGSEITRDWWQTLDSDIIPSLGVKRDDSYLIQAYDDRFKGLDKDKLEASVMEAYIPLQQT